MVFVVLCGIAAVILASISPILNDARYKIIIRIYIKKPPNIRWFFVWLMVIKNQTRKIILT
jgi:hypothetical protein